MGQVMATLGDAQAISSSKCISQQLEITPWLKTATSDVWSRYIENTAQQRLKLKREFPGQPEAAAEADARQAKMQKITQAAAEKIRAEAQQKEAKAAEEQLELVKAAAVELPRHEYGKKQKVAPSALQEKLKNACWCHMSMAAGMHKDRCNLHLVSLRSLLQQTVEQRTKMEDQVRTRTKLSEE